MHRQIPAHLDHLSKLIVAENGRVFKTVGDAVCAVFDDSERALRAARACQSADAGFPIRVAVASGEARAQGDDYFGPALNLVARLLSLGEPERVLFPSSIRPELPHRKLGSVSLKGIPDLVAVSELANDLPPLILPCAGPNTLPQRLTPVLGRDALTVDLVARLETARLITLIGFGGTGKTRLAIEVASQVTGHFPGGVFFCDLSEVPVGSELEQIQGVLAGQSAGLVPDRPHLLLIDNCEHLLRNCSQMIQTMLEATANLRVLATSRVPLTVVGQQNVQVPGLAVDSGEAAASLFCDRVREQTGEVPTDLNTVAQICRYLDGIPLALEIAAARCGSFTVQQVYDRMKSSSAFLRRPDALNDRHQGMSSVIAWSYLLLSPAAQTSLTQLSIMLGGFDYWGAGAILDKTDQDELDQLIEELVRASLLVFRDGRYRFFEPVREFGLERLRGDGDVERSVKDRLANYIEELASEAHPHLTGPEQDRWIARLSAEHPNTRSAFEWMVDPARRAELAVKLHGFWYTTGRYREGRAWAEAALARLPDESISADVYSMAGVLAWAERDLEQADRYLAQAVEQIESAGSSESKIKILNNRGMLLATRGDLAGASDLFLTAEAAARSPGDRALQAVVISNRGRIFSERNEYAQAETLLRRSLAMANDLLDDVLVTRIEGQLASTLRLDGRPQECIELLLRSLNRSTARGEAGRFAGLAMLLCLAAEECGVPADSQLQELLAYAHSNNIELRPASEMDRQRLMEITFPHFYDEPLTDHLLAGLKSLADASREKR